MQKISKILQYESTQQLFKLLHFSSNIIKTLINRLAYSFIQKHL